jgi:hypothetical protein
MLVKFGVLTCCVFHLAASPAHSLSYCPFASMFLGERAAWSHANWGCVALASLLDGLGLQPLQIIWLKACVNFFATACSAFRGKPMLWEAMRANVELSKECRKAWCARPSFSSVLRCEEMDMCNPPEM